MQSSRKRKQISGRSSIKPPRTTAGCRRRPTEDPYSDYPRPTAEECRSVRDDLFSLRGFPQEFVKYREQRLQMALRESQFLTNGGDCGEKESVLDGLIRTVLSQNTTEVNSERAFGNLKCAFPTWEQVLAAESKGIEDAIRCGGLAPTKSSCIKNLLNCLLQQKGKLCMEYLRELSVEAIKAELSHFKGIGPKTVACVLMFQLQKDDFPVDTHVSKVNVVVSMDATVQDIKKTYLHLNQRIPDELKFDLNCLLYTHGKACKRCSNRNVGGLENETGEGHCPLLAYHTHHAPEK
ncbi:putative DNA glycosylase At3g47830 isoform X2 [Primulina huaijiensis]|uniref:putative DNA glycosylase At3g47830 isoform X2 n=1 Tax=Primulina huaijiensis TaxID=1492673 RepID=UPI003CC6F767